MIPESRPKSKIEAAAIITADLQDGVERSHREYGRILQWDHKTVKTFLASGAIVNLSNSPDKSSDNNMFGSDIPQELTLDNNSPNAPHSFPKYYPDNVNNNKLLQETIPQSLPTDSPITPHVYNKEIKKDNPCRSHPSENLFSLWNQVVQDSPLSKVREFSSTRQKKCAARIKERSLDKWGAIFQRIADTPFLCGQNDRSWKADFDWIIANDDNAAKVLEGKYDRTVSTSRPSDNRYNEIFAGA